MLKLDNNLLDELGLGSLPEDQKRSMLQHIYDTLELRVGTNLANQMTDQQLEEFEKFIDDGGDANQAQALQWLETNLPNYKQVVNEVFEALKAEIKQMAPQIVVASAPTGQQPAQAPSQVAPTMPAQSPVPAAASAPTAPQPQVPQQPFQHQDPAGYQQPQMPPQAPVPPMPAPQQPVQDQGQQGAQVYPFPSQQPPAGPGAGGYQQQRPPQYPGGQQTA